MIFPEIIPNWIAGKEQLAIAGDSFDKKNPHNGKKLYKVTRSQKEDVECAVNEAAVNQCFWSNIPPVQRGKILKSISLKMGEYREDLATIISLETGKSMKDALGEVEGAISLADFFAGEGQRLYGKTTTSGVLNKYAITIRKPVGVAGLIIAANTPIANIAWKVFPALICGNSVIVKSAEDAPGTGWFFGKIAHEAGLPPGILNIVQGYGKEAGEPLVSDKRVGVISFTGSTAVGTHLAQIAGKRLCKISLELGGKNALVVCDDADLDLAVNWTILSAFSNAGQRCASASRIIIFEEIYDEFVQKLLDSTQKLSLGISDENDLGPVVNEKQLSNMLASINEAKDNGARILTGGKKVETDGYRDGCYLEPTIITDVDSDANIAQNELFGPITVLFKASGFHDSIRLVNCTNYGLTAAIHTKNLDRAGEFIRLVETGVCVINGGTYGSEPHMPFGGKKMSGNGTREPGTEALDIYSDLMDVYFNINPQKV